MSSKGLLFLMYLLRVKRSSLAGTMLTDSGNSSFRLLFLGFYSVGDNCSTVVFLWREGFLEPILGAIKLAFLTLKLVLLAEFCLASCMELITESSGLSIMMEDFLSGNFLLLLFLNVSRSPVTDLLLGSAMVSYAFSIAADILNALEGRLTSKKFSYSSFYLSSSIWNELFIWPD